MASVHLTSFRDGRTTAGLQIWLFAVAALIFLMVLVGGATRLTDSGLSITEWKPILGALPPLSAADWQEAFAKYQTIPEYTEVNAGITLDQFKVIYWWEWSHRLLGRLIGVVFLLPFLWFLWRGAVPARLRLPLLGIFVLGGFQGALGWYMVQSGLVDRVDVSQYRLAAHLSVAILIYGAVLWVLMGLMRTPDRTDVPLASRWIGFSAAGLVVATFLQIILGAFVAGMRAGLVHNTWPLMDGQWIPDGLGIMSPWYANLFENVLTVQFNHRVMAYVIALWAAAHSIALFKSSRLLLYRNQALALSCAILGQVALGISTLLASVPFSLGLAHQAGALLVLTIALYHAHSVWGGIRTSTERVGARSGL